MVYFPGSWLPKPPQLIGIYSIPWSIEARKDCPGRAYVGRIANRFQPAHQVEILSLVPPHVGVAQWCSRAVPTPDVVMFTISLAGNKITCSMFNSPLSRSIKHQNPAQLL